jgi:hypothetical protein
MEREERKRERACIKGKEIEENKNEREIIFI